MLMHEIYSKTMTAMWRCLFFGSLSPKPLAANMFAVTLWWNISRLFLRLQVILRPWGPSELFQLSLVFTSGHHWYHTTCQKFTKDILPWVTLSQAPSHMHAYAMSIPYLTYLFQMKWSIILWRNPRWRRTTNFSGHRYNPGLTSSCRWTRWWNPRVRVPPKVLSYIAPEKMGGWKTILSYGVKITVQGRTVKLPGCFCRFMTVLYTSISCKHAIPYCYSRDCFRFFLL